MSDPRIVTFGCRLNSFESEVIRTALDKASLEDVIVFNTCAVTQEAERKARQAIRRASKKFPHKRLIITGCSAQINPDSYASMPEVHHVLGNQEKMQDISYMQLRDEHARSVVVSNIMQLEESASHLVESFDGKARGYLEIQNGCNHRCTFCTIPFGRGNNRSVPVGEIVRSAQRLVENGYHELVLTGVDITDYGHTLPGNPTLGQLCRRLLALVPGLQRLRLSSVDVAEIDEDLQHLMMTEPRLMPYIHISVQAGDDLILKRMKRRHLRGDVLKFCARLHRERPDILFGADIIAGFPTETEEMFVNTMRLVEEAPLTLLHVFPYSERDGTPAARMPQVPKPLRQERAMRLRALGDAMKEKACKAIDGQKARILVEQPLLGRMENYLPVTLPTPAVPGTLLTCEIQYEGQHNRLAAMATEEGVYGVV